MLMMQNWGERPKAPPPAKTCYDGWIVAAYFAAAVVVGVVAVWYARAW